MESNDPLTEPATFSSCRNIDTLRDIKSFFDRNPSKDEIWRLLEYLLWRHQDSPATLVEWFEEVASAGQGFSEKFLENQYKGVCGKEIKQREPVYKCNTCAADNTCIQCVTCYQSADHTGHDVRMMFAGGGCCDCGDPESWSEKGFCKDHKGPNKTTEMLKLDSKVEIPCRMVCGYLCYLLSHAFSTQYNDVIYLPKSIADKSGFAKTQQEFVNSVVPGYNNSRIESFPNSVLNHNLTKKEFVLFVHNDENHSFDDVEVTSINSLGCNKVDALECIAWRVQMFEKTYLCCLNSITERNNIATQWQELGMKVTKTVRESKKDGLTRVISKDLVLELCNLLGHWCKDSEILRRIIAQSLMHSIDDFHANCSLFDIKTFKCPIPGWIDTWKIDDIGNFLNENKTNESKNDNDNEMKMASLDSSPQHKRSSKYYHKSDYRKQNPYINENFVHETMTPVYYFVLNDYAMDKKYRDGLNEMWFALMCVPEFKHRMCQVFTFAYKKLCDNLDMLIRNDSFFSLSVQLFTIPTMTCSVVRTHDICEIAMDTLTHVLCDLKQNWKALQLCHLKLQPHSAYHQTRPKCNIFKKPSFSPLHKCKIKINGRTRNFRSRRWVLFNDLRYILTNEPVMPYIILHKPGVIKNWLYNLCTMQQLASSQRKIGSHIVFEDDTWKEVFDLNLQCYPINRIMILGIYRLFLDSSDNDDNSNNTSDRPAGKDNKFEVKMTQEAKEHVWQLIVDLIKYGLTLIDYKPFKEIHFIDETFDEYKMEKMVFEQENGENDIEMTEEKKNDDLNRIEASANKKKKRKNVKIERMKHKGGKKYEAHLNNLERGSLTVDLLRVDRDRFSIFLPLSRFLTNLSLIYLQTRGGAFDELIERVLKSFEKSHCNSNDNESENSDRIEQFRKNIVLWIDQCVRISTFVEQKKADLWRKNGDSIANVVYNYERLGLYHQLRAFDIGLLRQSIPYLTAPNMMALMVHRFALHNWFTDHQIQYGKEGMNAMDHVKAIDYSTNISNISSPGSHGRSGIGISKSNDNDENKNDELKSNPKLSPIENELIEINQKLKEFRQLEKEERRRKRHEKKRKKEEKKDTNKEKNNTSSKPSGRLKLARNTNMRSSSVASSGSSASSVSSASSSSSSLSVGNNENTQIGDVSMAVFIRGPGDRVMTFERRFPGQSLVNGSNNNNNNNDNNDVTATTPSTTNATGDSSQDNNNKDNNNNDNDNDDDNGENNGDNNPDSDMLGDITNTSPLRGISGASHDTSLGALNSAADLERDDAMMSMASIDADMRRRQTTSVTSPSQEEIDDVPPLAPMASDQDTTRSLTEIIITPQVDETQGINGSASMEMMQERDGYNRKLMMELMDLNHPLETGWIHWCDHERTLKMINSFFTQIIVLIGEPLYHVRWDQQLTEKDYTYIRHECIQWLILSKMAYSELVDKLTMADEDLNIKKILNEIAVYEAPQGLESAKFRLKDEFYDEYDPYFHKFSTEEHTKCYEKYNTFMKRKLGASNNNKNDKNDETPANDDNNESKSSDTKGNDVVMYPPWPQAQTKYCDEYRLNLLTTRWMGIMWNCILHHVYVKDLNRYNASIFQCVLRLLGMTVEALKNGIFDNNEKSRAKLIDNFVTAFEFRLTNRFDFDEQEPLISDRIRVQRRRKKKRQKRLAKEEKRKLKEKLKQEFKSNSEKAKKKRDKDDMKRRLASRGALLASESNDDNNKDDINSNAATTSSQNSQNNDIFYTDNEIIKNDDDDDSIPNDSGMNSIDNNSHETLEAAGLHWLSSSHSNNHNHNDDLTDDEDHEMDEADRLGNGLRTGDDDGSNDEKEDGDDDDDDNEEDEEEIVTNIDDNDDGNMGGFQFFGNNPQEMAQFLQLLAAQGGLLRPMADQQQAQQPPPAPRLDPTPMPQQQQQQGGVGGLIANALRQLRPGQAQQQQQQPPPQPPQPRQDADPLFQMLHGLMERHQNRQSEAQRRRADNRRAAQRHGTRNRRGRRSHSHSHSRSSGTSRSTPSPPADAGTGNDNDNTLGNTIVRMNERRQQLRNEDNNNNNNNDDDNNNKNNKMDKDKIEGYDDGEEEEDESEVFDAKYLDAMEQISKIHGFDETGKGTVIWYLVHLLIDTNNNKLDNVQPSQKIFIEKLLNEIYRLNIDEINDIITPLWQPKDLTKSKKSKKKSKKEKELEKRRKKAEKARKKAMAKMQQQTEKFVTNNENQLLEDEKQELLEEKQQLDACGIGAKYQCIVCRSRHNQDEMGLMACCQQSSLLYHLVDDTCKAFENENSVNRLNRLKQLNENDGNTRIGSNFTFCGHAVHWSCFDTYMTQVHAKDAGDQYHFGSSTIRLSHHEFVCPYCKTISNILIPLQYVHRNSFLESSDIGTLIKDVKLSNMLKSDFFDSQLSIFDSSCFKLWSMDAINVILLNSLTKTHANMITDFFQRFNNIEYYLNESENDSKLYEINNIRKGNASKDVRQLKLAVKLSQSLHYSISSLEVKYRCHSKQERKDRLARSVALFNTLVSSVWSLFALYSIQQHSKQLHAMNSFSKLSMTENDVSMENDGNNNDNVSQSNLSASAQGSMDYSLLDKRSPSPNPPSFSMSGSNISNENMSNMSANSRAQQLRHSFQTGLKGLKRIGNMGKTWISNKVANRGKSNLPLLLDEKGMILLEQSSFGYLQKRFGYNQENSGFNDKPIVAKEDSKANNNSNVHGTKKLSNFMSLASKTKSDDINEIDEKEMSLDNEKNSFARTYDAFEIFVRCVLLHPNMLTIVVRQSGAQTETPLTPNKVQSFAMNAISGGLNKTPIFMPLPQTAASESNDNDNNSNNKNNNNDESIEKQALNRSTSSVSSSSATSLTPTLLPMSLDHGATQNEQAQLNGKSLSELYHILLSCFTMKFTQISVQYVMFSMGMTNNRNVRNPQMYEKYDLTDWFEIIRKECLLISNNDNNNEENTKIKQNALYYVIVRILPFLRKCCLLLNTFGLVEKGIIENTLWTSIPDNATTDENISMICVKTSENALNKNEQNKKKKNNDNDTSIETGNKASNVNFHFEYDCDMVKVLNETNKLCQVLQLPKINDCLKLFASLTSENGENGNNENGNNENDNEDDGLMLNTIHGWICNYLSTMIRSTIKHENEELKYLFNNSVLKPLTNTIKLPKLAILPQHFDPLFQTAYEMHCDNKPKTVPEDSAICLLCGKFLCINCCRYDASNNGEIVTSRHRNESLKGSLTLHAKQCGFGKCVFLWLQRSDVILIYEHAAAVFNSPYLDGYGEEDSGLRRGGLLYLNHTRLNKLTQLVSDQMINNKVCQLRSRGKHYLRNWF